MNMVITIESISNDLDILLKSDHLIINENIIKTLLLLRNIILEYGNEYSKISDLPNELIQHICKFIL